MTRYSATLLMCFALSSIGCTTHRFLDRSSVRQARTSSDVLQRQVLDNIAAFANDRAALPHFSVITDGTSQVTDGGTLSNGLNFNPFGLTGVTLTGNGSRSLAENWKLAPVTSAGRVRRLRCAFQLAFGHPYILSEDASKRDPVRCLPVEPGEWDVFVPEGCIPCIKQLVGIELLPSPKCCKDPTTGEDVKCVKELEDGWRFKTKADADHYQAVLQQSLVCKLPAGWFCTGSKHEAHKCGCKWYGDCCCMFGYECGTYVWVAPGREDDFARFTLSVLALATLDPPPKAQEIKVELSPIQFGIKAKVLKAALSAQQAMSLLDSRDDKNQPLMNFDAPEAAMFGPQALDIGNPDTLDSLNIDELQLGLIRLRHRLRVGLDVASSKLQSSTRIKLQGLNKLPAADQTAEAARIEQLQVVASRVAVQFPQAIADLDEAIQAIDAYHAATLQPPTIRVEEQTDVFSRPGNMPMSRGNTGIEFQPNFVVP